MTDDPENSLEKERLTYAAHKPELLEQAEGKFVLIKGDQILGVFDTQKEAIRHGYATSGPGAFMTKQILPIDPVYQIYATAVGG